MGRIHRRCSRRGRTTATDPRRAAGSSRRVAGGYCLRRAVTWDSRADNALRLDLSKTSPRDNAAFTPIELPGTCSTSMTNCPPRSGSWWCRDHHEPVIGWVFNLGRLISRCYASPSVHAGCVVLSQRPGAPGSSALPSQPPGAPGDADHRRIQVQPSSATSNLVAAALSSIRFPFPHFGEIQHDGQPASQPQLVSRSAAARHHWSATSKPRSA